MRCGVLCVVVMGDYGAGARPFIPIQGKGIYVREGCLPSRLERGGGGGPWCSILVYDKDISSRRGSFQGLAVLRRALCGGYLKEERRGCGGVEKS